MVQSDLGVSAGAYQDERGPDILIAHKQALATGGSGSAPEVQSLRRLELGTDARSLIPFMTVLRYSLWLSALTALFALLSSEAADAGTQFDSVPVLRSFSINVGCEKPLLRENDWSCFAPADKITLERDHWAL